MTKEAVKSLTGDGKAKYAAAKAKYDLNFAFGKPLYEYPFLEPDGWEYYLGDADTVEDLVAMIDRLLVRATDWKKRQDERAAAPATPALAVSTGSKPQATQPKQLSKPRNQKAAQPTDIVFGAASHAAVPQTARPTLAAVPTLPPKLSYIQRSLDTWKGTDHDGKDGSRLTLEDVQKVVDYVRAKWAATPFKGEGSGRHQGTWQLKISELNKIGNKSATWHLTLSRDVYSALQVQEAGS